MRNYPNYLIAIVSTLALAGCASDNTPPSQISASQQQQPQPSQEAELAAYAGGHPYPATITNSQDLRVAAIVDANSNLLKIYNFTHSPIVSSELWVNRSFVRPLHSIPANSGIAVQYANLYNALGVQLSKAAQPVQLVQLKVDNTLYTLEGPVMEK